MGPAIPRHLKGGGGDGGAVYFSCCFHQCLHHGGFDVGLFSPMFAYRGRRLQGWLGHWILETVENIMQNDVF